MTHLIIMYAENIESIYNRLSWLAQCITKKTRRGITPDGQHLALCPTMRTIIREAEQYASRDMERRATTEECRAAADYLSRYVLEDMVEC